MLIFMTSATCDRVVRSLHTVARSIPHRSRRPSPRDRSKRRGLCPVFFRYRWIDRSDHQGFLQGPKHRSMEASHREFLELIELAKGSHHLHDDPIEMAHLHGTCFSRADRNATLIGIWSQSVWYRSGMKNAPQPVGGGN